MGFKGLFRGWIEAFALAGTLGVQLAVGVFLGGLAGYWLDRSLHTAPWLLIVGGMLGFAAWLAAAARFVTRRRPDRERDP